jgi:hypothetical protein
VCINANSMPVAYGISNEGLTPAFNGIPKSNFAPHENNGPKMADDCGSELKGGCMARCDGGKGCIIECPAACVASRPTVRNA